MELIRTDSGMFLKVLCINTTSAYTVLCEQWFHSQTESGLGMGLCGHVVSLFVSSTVSVCLITL